MHGRTGALGRYSTQGDCVDDRAMSKSLTEGENAALGVFAAIIEGVLLQPTLYWKNARAQQLPFTINPRVIYRGTSASLFNEMQMMGLQFGLTAVFQRIHGSSNGDREVKLSRTQEMSSATMGGVVASIFASPVELVMIQQQRFGGSFPHTIRRIVGDYSFRALFRGLVPAMLRDAIYVSGLLGVTPILQDLLMTDYNMGETQAGLAASLAGGILGAIPSHPLDMIKTCMQGDMAQSTYRGFVHTARCVWLEGGLKRLFDGCFWRTFNITATVYIANECRVRLPKYLLNENV